MAYDEKNADSVARFASTGRWADGARRDEKSHKGRLLGTSRVLVGVLSFFLEESLSDESKWAKTTRTCSFLHGVSAMEDAGSEASFLSRNSSVESVRLAAALHRAKGRLTMTLLFLFPRPKRMTREALPSLSGWRSAFVDSFPLSRSFLFTAEANIQDFHGLATHPYIQTSTYIYMYILLM